MSTPKKIKFNVPKKTVVKRKRWADATWQKTTHGDVSLRDSDTKRQCCLGFVCQQAGVPIEEYENYGTPLDLRAYKFDTKDKALFTKAININDNESITRAEREVKLKDLFKSHGYSIVFE